MQAIQGGVTVVLVQVLPEENLDTSTSEVRCLAR